VKQVKVMEVGSFETSSQASSPSGVGSSFVYIEQGASRLVDAALAAAQVTRTALQFEGDSLVLGVRQALRHAGAASLTFVAAQDSSDELRQQLYALVQVLLEEFPWASVRVRFVA
jgi:hypothetical protein